LRAVCKQTLLLRVTRFLLVHVEEILAVLSTLALQELSPHVIYLNVIRPLLACRICHLTPVAPRRRYPKPTPAALRSTVQPKLAPKKRARTWGTSRLRHYPKFPQVASCGIINSDACFAPIPNRRSPPAADQR